MCRQAHVAIVAVVFTALSTVVVAVVAAIVSAICVCVAAAQFRKSTSRAAPVALRAQRFNV